MPLLLPARHMYIPKCISPADSHSIPLGASDMLQTCTGAISITADTLSSISPLLDNHRSTSPHLPTSFLNHLRWDILSISNPVSLYSFHFSSDFTSPLSRLDITFHFHPHAHTSHAACKTQFKACYEWIKPSVATVRK